MSAGGGLRVSENGRYFTTAHGKPFVWVGDTQWNLWRCHTGRDAGAILESCGQKRFSVVQVMLNGWGAGAENDPVFRVPAATSHGEAYPDRNPLKPNPDYFSHVDGILALAESLGLVMVIGLQHPRLMLATRANAREWGRQVGERWRSHRNIVWVPTYAIPEGEHLEVARLIAAGLHEGTGGTALMTCHPDPADPYCTSGVAHNEPWLAFNSIQTWKRFDCIHEAVTADYRRVPPKPVVMAEGAYEDGAEYSFPVTPHLVRKQAYWTWLAGGHHTYGHNDNWQVLDTWRRSLDSPGAVQMGVYRTILETLSWWDLVPDQSLLSTEPGSGAGLTLAARSSKGEWIAAYVPEPRAVSLRTDKAIAARAFSAAWIDPRTGESVGAGEEPSAAGFASRTPAGWEDGLLVLRAV